VRINSALASFAYAAGMRRLGHRYFMNVVATLYMQTDHGAVVY
jgi:hypothetical protein